MIRKTCSETDGELPLDPRGNLERASPSNFLKLVSNSDLDTILDCDNIQIQRTDFSILHFINFDKNLSISITLGEERLIKGVELLMMLKLSNINRFL